MIEHHGFEMDRKEFDARKAWPSGPHAKGSEWRGEYASQSPLNAFFLTTEGGGAEGTRGYLALPGAHSDQFYAEVTPYWESSRRIFDLRDTRTTLCLKALGALRVAQGYRPHLFIDDHDVTTNTFCGWYVTSPLAVGEEWTLNTVDLVNDERLWTRYSQDRSLDHVLSHVGFIGVMYLNGKNYTGVDACGVLGMDEFRFNIPLTDRS